MAEVVNANDVTRALSVDYSPLGTAIQNYDQLSYRRSLLNEQRRQQKQADDYHRAAIVAKTFKDLETGTATPWDRVREAQVKKAYDDVIEYQRANPNASPVELDYFARNAASGIASGIDNAKLLDKAAHDWATKAGSKFSHLDQNKLYKYAQSKYFLDDKNNPLASPSSAYNLDADIEDPAIRSNLLDRALTDAAVRKELAEMKPEVVTSADGRFQYEARPYMNAQNKLRSEEVAWDKPIPNTPSIIPGEVLMGRAPVNSPRVPMTARETYAGAPSEMLNRIASGPAFKDALIQETLRLAQQNPDLLKGASPEQVAQIAAYNLLANHAATDGYKPTSPTEAYKFQQQQEVAQRTANHQAFSENMQLANFSRGMQKDAESKRRYEERKVRERLGYNEDGQLSSMFRAVDYFNNTPLLPENATDMQKMQYAAQVKMKDDAKALMEANRGAFNIDGVDYNSYDLSGLASNTQFHQPGNSKQPVHLRLVKTGTQNGDLLVVTPINSDGTPIYAGRKVYGKGIKSLGSYYVNKDAYEELQRYAPQEKKVKDYRVDEMQNASQGSDQQLSENYE